MALGSALGAASRLAGRGSGTVIGSRVSLAIDPGVLAGLAKGRRLALVSGTNGKTTTSKFLASALQTRGPIAHNDGGSNLPGGVLSALAARPGSDVGVLEVDEGWLPYVSSQVRPAVVALLNLSRDQLDRVSEVRNVARRWREMLEGAEGVSVVANCDDPIVAWAAMGCSSTHWVAGGQPWRSDATGCPSCGGQILYDPGSWHCGSGCGLQRPEPAAWLDGSDLVVRGDRIPIALKVPGAFNRANAAIAAMAAELMGVSVRDALSAMSEVAEVAGRYDVVEIPNAPFGLEARLLMAKNPAGWVEMFDLVAPPPAPVVVAVNARVADGRDPSWLWDVPFEKLAGRFVVASGDRWRDLSVRLLYAEVDHVGMPSVPDAVLEAARRHRLPGETDPKAIRVEVVANYTAFQDLRRSLAQPEWRRFLPWRKAAIPGVAMPASGSERPQSEVGR